MARESLQHTLDRVRSPRVQITYDVEVGDAIEKKEIPFVVGVLGDLSGKPEEPLPPLKQRKFIEIDRDNFNTVLQGMKPRLAYKVDNKLTDEDTKLAVELNFKSMDDFQPDRVAEQITPVRKLLDARKRLSELLSKLDGNDKLDELLQNVLSSTESIEELGKSTGVGSKDEE